MANRPVETGSEQALRKSEERLRLAAKAAGFGTFDVDVELAQVMCSPELYEIFGLPQDTPVDLQVITERVYPEDRPAFESAAQRLLDPSGPEQHEFEYRIVRPSGQVRWVRNTSRSYTSHESTPRLVRIVGTVQDVTERKRSALALERLNESLEKRVRDRTELLRRATSELLLTEERERRNLATDLHDSLGQELALARLKLSDLTGALGQANIEKATRLVQSVADLIDRVERSSRLLIRQISPLALYDMGLIPALKTLADQMEEMHGLRVDLPETDVELNAASEAVRVIIYRGVRELLHNVIKHSTVRRARVDIDRCEHHLLITVSDAGGGFDPDASTKGLGLFSLRDRVEALGGSLEITSARGRGTDARIMVPMSMPDGDTT